MQTIPWLVCSCVFLYIFQKTLAVWKAIGAIKCAPGSPLTLSWSWRWDAVGTTQDTEPYSPLKLFWVTSYRKWKASLWAAVTYSTTNTSVSPLIFQGHLAVYYNLCHSAFAAAGWDIHTGVSLEYKCRFLVKLWAGLFDRLAPFPTHGLMFTSLTRLW